MEQNEYNCFKKNSPPYSNYNSIAILVITPTILLDNDADEGESGVSQGILHQALDCGQVVTVVVGLAE